MREYYFNAIRDCDRKVALLLEAPRNNGMDKNTIVVFTADHGELGGNHQMRGKGTSAYRQQNHPPLMIQHPAFEGGTECEAITSQLDLTPTIIGLTGKNSEERARASEGLMGRDFSAWLRTPAQAGVHPIRPAALYNFDMLSLQDPKSAALTVDTRVYREKEPEQQLAMLANHAPDFLNRVAIRSIWDGRYRFTRYFSPVRFNTPASLEELLAKNDVEVHDLRDDSGETNNLAADARRNGDLLVALNQEANRRIAEEVGDDDGHFLPIRDGKWHFPPSSER